MKLHSDLYREVETQINRLRLVRVLFFVEVLLSIALAVRLMIAGWSWATLAWLEILAILALLNFDAVQYRFRMYCRAVERSYKVLVLDAPPPWQPR